MTETYWQWLKQGLKVIKNSKIIKPVIGICLLFTWYTLFSYFLMKLLWFPLGLSLVLVLSFFVVSYMIYRMENYI